MSLYQVNRIHFKENTNIREQVNKFLVKYIFFDRFIFISQHSLLSARYIWSNDSPIFSNRPNNMICPIFQNKPLFWWWIALLWWISFLRTISSGLETRNNRRELNLGNMLDGEAIRSEIRWIWPSVPSMCEPALFWWKSTFFFAK